MAWILNPKLVQTTLIVVLIFSVTNLILVGAVPLSVDSTPKNGTQLMALTTFEDVNLETRFPCKDLGPGEYSNPGFPSLYVTCHSNGEVEIHVCPVNSFYVEERKQCVENYKLSTTNTTAGVITTDNCDDVTFDCNEEGIFVYPGDNSLYFQCLKKEDKFQSICYSCSKSDGTVYSEEQQACIKPTEKSGDIKRNLKPEGKPHLSYNCDRYLGKSFAICRIMGPGFYGIPGDISIYLECYTTPENQVVGRCQTCKKSENGCYDDRKKICLANCGKRNLHQMYDCSTYHDASYPCSEAGYFANLDQTSIYFQCVMMDGVWKSYCYTCNSVKMTCYSEQHKACVANNGKPCANATVFMEDGTKIGSLTYTCAGYNNHSFPCQKLGPGTYVKHGDHSVYWKCGANGESECRECSKENMSCYDADEQRCVENCGKGPAPRPYNCSFDHSSYLDCPGAGVYAYQQEPSIYFRCRTSNNTDDEWQIDCFTCDSHRGTCFDDLTKTCVDGGGKPCREISDETIKLSKTNGTANLMNKDSVKTHSCIGYDGYLFNCPKPGNFTVPGDHSIFYTCEYKNGVLVPHCNSCPASSNSCFIDTKNKCEENCGIGTQINGTIRKYDCSGYDSKSFPCQKAGLFKHSQDTTVFFHCLKDNHGQWESRCYACNSRSRSCFSEKKQRCVIGCYDDKDPILDQPNIPLIYGDNCKGYGASAVPCGPLRSQNQTDKRTYFEHKGDPAVYFQCTSDAHQFKALCHKCPLSSCFDEAKQNCVTPCPEYVPIDKSNKSSSEPLLPYNCRQYSDDSYPCTKIGIYANPTDTSVYFYCSQEDQQFKSICYTCNAKLKSCFSDSNQACVYSETAKCGKISDTNGTKIAKSYDCSGYEHTIPHLCSKIGEGLWPMYGDPSVYFSCNGSKETGFIGKCFTCSKDKEECFDIKQGHCVQHQDCTFDKGSGYVGNVDHGKNNGNQWNCSKRSHKCVSEGLYADVQDTSIFHKCVKTKDGKLDSQCFTCSGGIEKTCFSQKKQVCLFTKNKTCTNEDLVNAQSNLSDLTSETYDCHGYNSQSFPCSKYPPGIYETPADRSIYFECKNGVAECKACNKETESIFIPDQKKCVQNLGKGQHRPYNCYTYNDHSYKCTDVGLFANPLDSSVFFKCVKNGTRWESHCYSCSSSNQTCFSNFQKACIYINGKSCGKGDPFLGSSLAKSPEVSRTYDCSGYNMFSFPCSKYGVGQHAHPADLSVYFSCQIIDNQNVAICSSCNSKTKTCYDETSKQCVNNCDKKETVIGHAIHSPIEHMKNQTEIHVTLKPIDQTTQIPISQTTTLMTFVQQVTPTPQQQNEGSEEEQTDETEDEQTDEPEEEQTDEPEEDQTDESEEKQTDNPEEQHTAEPDEQQTDEPEDHQTEEPEQQQTDESGEQQTEDPEDQQTDQPVQQQVDLRKEPVDKTKIKQNNGQPAKTQKGVPDEHKVENLVGNYKNDTVKKEKDEHEKNQKYNSVNKENGKPVKNEKENSTKEVKETSVKKQNEKSVKKEKDNDVKKKQEKTTKVNEENSVKKEKQTSAKKEKETPAKKKNEEAVKKDNEKSDKQEKEKSVKKKEKIVEKDKPVKKVKDKSVTNQEVKPAKKPSESGKKQHDESVKNQDDPVTAKTSKPSKKKKDQTGKTTVKPAKKQKDKSTKKKKHNTTDLSDTSLKHQKLKPYDCSTTNPKSYPCTKEGGYWANKEHTSLFHKCIRNSKDQLEAICYSCNQLKNACFSNNFQACITIGGIFDCGNKDPIKFPGHQLLKKSWSYDKAGYKYKPPSFPCAHEGAGIHEFPGDLSVYVKCEKNEGEWKETFKVCGNQLEGGFFYKDTLQCEPEYKWPILMGSKASQSSDYADSVEVEANVNPIKYPPQPISLPNPLFG